MRSSFPAARFPICALLIASLTGCGGATVESKPLPATVPATGVVSMDGKPLSLATVLFDPS